ncbi:hypothetical protein [Thioalkalivibrio sp.]|uniref:hypothetical protein n=1 Tax=Thioalkalivibrio sp. TaxID=2093813 RepID=UPI003567C1FC
MPWKGNINELLSEEQLKVIEDALAGAPEGIVIDKRGMKLNRYPGLLSDLAGDGEPLKVIASERPVTEDGMVLISNAPIPEIERAVLVIRTGDDFKQRIEGHALPSRLGRREEDSDAKTVFHYAIFETEGPRD